MSQSATPRGWAFRAFQRKAALARRVHLEGAHEDIRPRPGLPRGSDTGALRARSSSALSCGRERSEHRLRGHPPRATLGFPGRLGLPYRGSVQRPRRGVSCRIGLAGNVHRRCLRTRCLWHDPAASQPPRKLESARRTPGIVAAVGKSFARLLGGPLRTACAASP